MTRLSLPYAAIAFSRSVRPIATDSPNGRSRNPVTGQPCSGVVTGTNAEKSTPGWVGRMNWFSAMSTKAGGGVGVNVPLMINAVVATS